MASTRPVNNYPPELRERAIRMMAEVRGEAGEALVGLIGEHDRTIFAMT